jgi:hypothetical protein
MPSNFWSEVNIVKGIPNLPSSGERFRAVRDFDAEEVIDLAGTGTAAALRSGRLDRCGRFQPDVGHAVALVPEQRVDQLVASFGFVFRH